MIELTLADRIFVYDERIRNTPWAQIRRQLAIRHGLEGVALINIDRHVPVRANLNNFIRKFRETGDIVVLNLILN